MTTAICIVLTCLGFGWQILLGQETTQLSLYEAEILVYLMPDAQTARRNGYSVTWELWKGSDLNQADYFFFSVYNASRPNPAGSVLIGHYAINKHTADVWMTVPRQIVESEELKGVQEILRRAHRIGEETVDRYRSRSFWGTDP